MQPCISPSAHDVGEPLLTLSRSTLPTTGTKAHLINSSFSLSLSLFLNSLTCVCDPSLCSFLPRPRYIISPNDQQNRPANC